jgi:hypothetical protein
MFWLLGCQTRYKDIFLVAKKTLTKLPFTTSIQQDLDVTKAVLVTSLQPVWLARVIFSNCGGQYSTAALHSSIYNITTVESPPYKIRCFSYVVITSCVISNTSRAKGDNE